MASLDPGLELMIEMAIASGLALIGLWKLKKRTDERDLKKTRGAT
jgi:hypothetical protein